LAKSRVPSSPKKTKVMASPLPMAPAAEEHKDTYNLPEVILGGQDGLVNVLGLVLGLGAATASSKIVIVAGLAAAFTESVSMAAVAYTSKLAEADYYQAEFELEAREIDEVPHVERKEIEDIYKEYGFKGRMLRHIVHIITSDKKIWLKIMMEQELKLTPVERHSVLPYAVLVGISAIVGSLLPLMPFFFLPTGTATLVAVLLSAFVLLGVGIFKAHLTLGRDRFSKGVQMMVIGMVSAFLGYLIGVIFKVQG